MNWTELVIASGLILAVVAIIRGRKISRGGSCCSNEGMDDDGYDLNRRERDERAD